MYDQIEYHTAILSGHIEPELKRLGDTGWELVCVFPINNGVSKFVFKRKKMK